MPHKPEIIGHRGAAGHVLENTLASFDHAISLGVDWVEMDIRRCASGELVVFHDDTLTRLGDTTDLLSELSWDELSTMKMEGEYAIPTLAQTLDHLAGRARLCIELKEEGLVPALAELVKPRIAGGSWDWKDIVFISFLHPELVALRQVMPEAAIAPIMAALPEDYAAFAEHLGAAAVHPCIHFINQAFMDDARARNIAVRVWTCNEPAHIERAITLGVDAIATDYPDRVHEQLAA
jgi:glycerophosphoryl diester phosphodiesterase